MRLTSAVFFRKFRHAFYLFRGVVMPRTAFLLIMFFLMPWSISQASPIYYEANNLSGNSWEYTYTVDNQLDTPIDGFTIWFDLGVYENLLITGSPNWDWDGFAAQPDSSLPDDGFADWLTFGLPINPGEVLAGFTVSFDYLGTATPGEQFFETFDYDFNLLSEGYTEQMASTASASVPEPGTLLLFGLGIAGLLWRRTQKI